MSKSLRHICIVGEIDAKAVETFFAELMQLEQEAPEKRIVLDISSHGGDADAGLAIAARIKASTCPIITRGFGKVESAAVLPWLAGTQRHLSSVSFVTLHEASMKVNGNAQEIMKEAKQLQAEEGHWFRVAEDFTGVSSALWAELTATNTTLSAQECHKLGIVHRLL